MTTLQLFNGVKYDPVTFELPAGCVATRWTCPECFGHQPMTSYECRHDTDGLYRPKDKPWLRIK